MKWGNASYMAKTEFKTVMKAVLIPVAVAVREGTSFAKQWEPGSQVGLDVETVSQTAEKVVFHIYGIRERIDL
jgi:hypothetical protein